MRIRAGTGHMVLDQFGARESEAPRSSPPHLVEGMAFGTRKGWVRQESAIARKRGPPTIALYSGLAWIMAATAALGGDLSGSGVSTDTTHVPGQSQWDRLAGRSVSDFEYRCVIVGSPSDGDEASAVPESLASVGVTESFYVEFWATDSGATNTGIVSSYADLDYPEECVAAGNVVHTDLFNSFTGGTVDGSTIDELGGSQLTAGVGVEPNWARIAHVQFAAQSACAQAEFYLFPASSESSAIGRGLIPISMINYGSCDLVINSAIAIPTVSEWGLVAMTLLVLAGGTLVLRRRRLTGAVLVSERAPDLVRTGSARGS